MPVKTWAPWWWYTWDKAMALFGLLWGVVMMGLSDDQGLKKCTTNDPKPWMFTIPFILFSCAFVTSCFFAIVDFNLRGQRPEISSDESSNSIIKSSSFMRLTKHEQVDKINTFKAEQEEERNRRNSIDTIHEHESFNLGEEEDFNGLGIGTDAVKKTSFFGSLVKKNTTELPEYVRNFERGGTIGSEREVDPLDAFDLAKRVPRNAPMESTEVSPERKKEIERLRASMTQWFFNGRVGIHWNSLWFLFYGLLEYQQGAATLDGMGVYAQSNAEYVSIKESCKVDDDFVDTKSLASDDVYYYISLTILMIVMHARRVRRPNKISWGWEFWRFVKKNFSFWEWIALFVLMGAPLVISLAGIITTLISGRSTIYSFLNGFALSFLKMGVAGMHASNLQVDVPDLSPFDKREPASHNYIVAIVALYIQWGMAFIFLLSYRTDRAEAWAQVILGLFFWFCLNCITRFQGDRVFTNSPDLLQSIKSQIPKKKQEEEKKDFDLLGENPVSDQENSKATLKTALSKRTSTMRSEKSTSNETDDPSEAIAI